MYLGMFSTIGRTGALQKGSQTQARECWIAARHCLAWWPLFGAFKSSLGPARHSVAYISWLPNSESRISNQTIAAKLRTV